MTEARDQHSSGLMEKPGGEMADAASEAKPLVSVVIATYNMGQHLAEAVSSVLAQTVTNLEVIVVDDGSTDDTREVLQAFASDRRVRIIWQENRGQPKAKNAGWRAARGRFIAFCDADDYWLPNKLALQMPLFERNRRVGVVYSKTLSVDSAGTIYPPAQRIQPKGDVLEQLFIRNRVPFGTAVVRRECLEQANGFDEAIPMGIDWDLWLRVALEWEFDCVSDATYVYRRWSGQMSHNWRGRYRCALLIMRRFLANNPGRLSPQTVATAYADTHTSLGDMHLQQGLSDSLVGLGHVATALRYRPSFWPAWRLLLTLPAQLMRATFRTAAGRAP